MNEPCEELRAERLNVTPSDAADREAILMAARLAGSRESYPRMSPAFRKRLVRQLEKGEPPPRICRRSALAAGLGLAAGAVGGTLGVPLLGLLAPSRPPPVATTQPSARADASRGSIEPRSELARWVDTGLNITELAEGIPRRVSAGAVSAFVVRRGARVVGMSSLCTHLPCELVWQSNMKVLNCPCHDLNFDVNGRSMSEGYPLPALPLVKVRVRNDGGVEVLGA